MASHGKWWSSFAPYWEHLERRHLTPLVAEDLLPEIAGPCLVVGSGQGLVVEHLRARGVAAIGLDLEREMLLRGKARRGVGGVQGDARRLPFADAAFRTVIVASGVVDYLDDVTAIAEILAECRRALAPGGALLVAFYRLGDEVRRVNERLGVVADGAFHMARLFEIQQTVRESPLACVGKIAAWTGRNRAGVLVGFTRLGLFMPRAIRDDAARIDAVIDRAAADGVSADELLASVPERIPYRDADAVRALLAEAGFPPAEIREHDDCLVCRLGKRSPAVPRGRIDEDPGAAPADAIVVARGLVKRFVGARRNAVDGVGIEVRRGAIHGILGPNGAGKSTTIRMLLGLLPPDAGEVRFDLGGPPCDVRSRVGYVPQELALYPKLTARENLAFFGRLYSMERGRLRARIDAVLREVGLTERGGDPVGEFSTGMMRRLNLAAGLVHEPQLLLLDEPTVGIDPQSRHRIYGVVEELKRRGVTILLTTHYMDEAHRLCDRLSIMDRGRVILEGPPSALLERYGAHRVEVAVHGEPRGIMDRVSRLPGVESAALEGALLIVRVRGAAAAAAIVGEITEIAAAEGARAELKSVRAPDLEALFLDATGEQLEREG
jgi:ABC-2 type transport system ATP-binding protein